MHNALKLVAISAAFTAAVPASAATIISTDGSAASFAATAGTVIDFNSAVPTGFTFSSVKSTLTSGTSATAAQPAFSDGSRYLAVLKNGSATLQSTTAYNSVSFFMGSIDSFNFVQLLNTSGDVIATFFGTQFTDTASGNQSLPATNRRVTITRDADEDAVGGVRFLSNGNSLEVDNVVFAVPEPATWAMMLVGFGMIGAASRFRSRRTNLAYV